jgi:hypothetical protein
MFFCKEKTLTEEVEAAARRGKLLEEAPAPAAAEKRREVQPVEWWCLLLRFP